MEKALTIQREHGLAASRKRHWLLGFAGFCACAIAYSASANPLYASIGVLVLVCMLATCTAIEGFVIIGSAQLLKDALSLTLFGHTVSFLLVAYPVLAYVGIFIRRERIETRLLIPLIPLFCLECMHMLGYESGTAGSVALWMMSLLHFALVMPKRDCKPDIFAYYALLVFALVTVSAINVISDFQQTGAFRLPGGYSQYFRLGDGNPAAAGANSIALQACFGLALSLCCYSDARSAGRKAFMAVSACLLAFLGLLTVSRAFLVELIIVVICGMIWHLHRGKRGTAILMCAGILTAGTVFWSDLQDIPVFSSFIRRFLEGDAERAALLQAGVTQWGRNTQTLFLGSGIYYPNVTSFTAHNLYLDALIAFGWGGSFLYASIFVGALWLRRPLSRPGLLQVLPLLVLLSYKWIAGSVRDVNFAYFFAIAASCAFFQRREGGDGLCRT